MSDLATRIEQATGPDRELDDEVALLFGWVPVPNPSYAGGLMGRWYRPDGSMTGHEGAPCITASIDAAMTLADDIAISTILKEAMDRLEDDGWPKGEYGKVLPRYVAAAAIRART